MTDSRGAQPLAIRCHRPFVPYAQQRKPMRPSLRRQMFGPEIHPQEQSSNPRWHGVVIVCLGLIAAYLCMSKGFNW